MRLMEITPITKDKLTPQKTSGRDDTGKRVIKDYDPDDAIGSGNFATAFASKKEPGTVRKVVSHVNDLEGDAYFTYVKMILQNQRMQSNRFFPKIFDIKVFKTPGDYDSDRVLYDYAIDMERLYEWTKLSHREALMIGKQLYHNFERLVKPNLGRIPAERRRASKKSGGRNARRGPATEHPYREVLMKLLRQTFMGYRGDKHPPLIDVKDTQFKQAVMLIRNMRLKSTHGMFSDIHDGNIMIRRTPQGVQIVLSDPVAA